MAGQGLPGLRRPESASGSFGTGVALGNLGESDLIEADDDLVVGRDYGDALLTGTPDHLHRGGVVARDVLLDEWHVVAAKELLSSVAPRSGLGGVDGDLC